MQSSGKLLLSRCQSFVGVRLGVPGSGRFAVALRCSGIERILPSSARSSGKNLSNTIQQRGGKHMILILIILILLVGGGGFYAGPGWGYYGGGGLDLILVIVLLFLLFGRRRAL